jgi:hypothetical protein
MVSELRIGSTSDDLGFTAFEANFSEGAPDVTMEMFECKVDDVAVHGTFHKIGFQEGDFIDFVVSADENGRLVAAAARNHQNRFLWVQPYKMRGNLAQLRHDILWGTFWSLAPPLAFAVYMFNDFANGEGGTFIVSTVFFCGLAIATLINFLVRRRFYSGSHDATRIFKAFGFPDPSNIDLPKGMAKAERQRARSGGDDPRLEVPWRYRY